MLLSKNELLKKYNDQRSHCQKWTRCMGYYRPTENYNIGKQSEFNERIFFVTQRNLRRDEC